MPTLRPVPLCLTSLALAYTVSGIAFLELPHVSFDGPLFNSLMLAALGLFLFGAIGLTYSSRWVQDHGLILALGGGALFAGGFWLLLDGINWADKSLTAAILFPPCALIVTGATGLMTPLHITYARFCGLIK